MEGYNMGMEQKTVSKNAHSPQIGLEIQGCCYGHKDEQQYPRSTVRGPQVCDEAPTRVVEKKVRL